MSPDTWAMLAIAAFVVLANLPYLLTLFDPNPLVPTSQLVASTAPGLLPGAPTIDPNAGISSQALGHLATSYLLGLHLPWWNPYEGTGMPLAGEMQSAALFPPTWLTLLSNGQLYEHLLLELGAGVATYWLLRRLLVSRPASTAGAIAFALNGTFSWFADATVNPVALLPLLLLGVECAYSAVEASRPGGWWLIAVAGAFSFLAGFPEVTYIDALIAVFWAAWRLGCLPRGRWGAFAGKCMAGSGVAALLCAPLVIAMGDYFAHADLGTHASALLGAQHLGPEAFPQVLMPYVYGPIFGYIDPQGVLPHLWLKAGGYLSASLLLLALAGLFSPGRRGLRIALFAWSVLAFARMYGVPHTLAGVIGVLPDMSRVAFFRYGSTSLELPVIILAALGVHELSTASAGRRRLLWVLPPVLVALALGVVEARTLTAHLPSAFGHSFYFAGSIAWAVAAVLAVIAASFLPAVRLRGPAVALVVAVDALAMFIVPELSAPRSAKLDTAPVAFLGRHLGTSRFYTLGPLQPNYGSYFRLRSLDATDLPPASFARYVHHRLDPVVDPTIFDGDYGSGSPSAEQELLRNLDSYRQAGVAYVLTPAGQALPESPSTFALAKRTPTTWIYRLTRALGYFTASLPRCTVTATGGQAARVWCPASAKLVRRETAFPGWRATVDGRPAPIRTADGVFQAVRVPAGTHTVSFSYQPPGIDWGYLAFAAGLACLLPAAARAGPRGARRRTGVAAPVAEKEVQVASVAEGPRASA